MYNRDPSSELDTFILFRNAAASSLKLRKSQTSTWISVGILNGKKSRYVESFHCNCTVLSSVLTFPHIISSRLLWPKGTLPSVVFKFGQRGLAAGIYKFLKDLRIIGENSGMRDGKSPFNISYANLRLVSSPGRVQVLAIHIFNPAPFPS
jgi:hypothetical protein